MSDPALADYLPQLASRVEGLASFDLATSEQAVRDLAEELGVKAGLLINASRAALTGQRVGPGIFEVMVTLGQECTVSRMREAAASLRI
jgi:glutamyl-tRNA synthetase